MKITVICVGRLKEKYLKDAMEEYLKRISRYAKVEILEIPDEKIPDNAGEKTEKQLLITEGNAILSKIKDNSFVTAMCVEGELVSSEELAELVSAAAMKKGHMTLIIGGSLGLDDRVKKKADKRISFGRITLPHQLMRIVLAEQLYRAFKINSGETYHK